MDEDEIKVRRNLVWLSSLIVGWWFIGVDLSEVTRKLLGTDKIDHPDRLWLVVFILMYYAVARFWNSEKAKESWERIRAHRREVFETRLNDVLQKDIALLKIGEDYCSRFIDSESVKKRLKDIDFGGSVEWMKATQGLTELRLQGFDPKHLRSHSGTVTIALPMQGRDTTAEGSVQTTTISVPYYLPVELNR